MAERLLCGVNHPALELWKDFSLDRLERDLSRAASLGAAVVRLLLPWEVFQPERERVPEQRLRELELLLDTAERLSLRVLPLLFARPPGGAQQIPEWLVEVFSGQTRKPRDFYQERENVRAQQLLIQVLAGAFCRHEALAGWDLGREISRLAPPSDPETARSWLLRLLEALKKVDERHPATFTFSQGELEEDRGLRPSRMAAELDFISVQALPAEAAWARAPDDAEAPAFLAHLVRALTGKEVLVSELGLPTGDETGSGAPPGLIRSEEEGARFYESALEAVRRTGAMGALAWCLDDFPASYSAMPHERFYGLFRAEGSPKPAVESLSRFARGQPERVEAAGPPRIDEGVFYRDPSNQLRAEYDKFLRPHSEPATD